MRQASPPLQEKPVALVDPAAPQPQAKPQKPKRAASEKRDERRKQVTERRRQPQIDNAPEVRAVDRRPQELDDDDDDDVRAPRPFFRDREREEVRRPFFFGFFGNDN